MLRNVFQPSLCALPGLLGATWEFSMEMLAQAPSQLGCTAQREQRAGDTQEESSALDWPPAGLALLDACAPPCPPPSPPAMPSVKARPEPLLGLPGPQVPLPSVDSSFSFSQCLSAPDVPCNTS